MRLCAHLTPATTGAHTNLHTHTHTRADSGRARAIIESKLVFNILYNIDCLASENEMRMQTYSTLVVAAAASAAAVHPPARAPALWLVIITITIS